MKQPFFRSSYARTGCAVIATALLAAAPHPVLAAGNFALSSFAAVPYTIAAVCDPAKPIAFVNLVLRNTGDPVRGPATVVASDPSGTLRGEAALPAAGLDAGAVLPMTVPLRFPPGAWPALAGIHPVLVSVGGQPVPLPPLRVTVPAGLCLPPAAPASPPTTSPAGAPTAGAPAGTLTRVAQHAPLPSVATAPPAYTSIGTNRSRTANLSVLVRPPAPANLHSVADGGGDCLPHVGLIGTLVCPDLVKSGDLLLIWDWEAGSGPAAIDGYKIYRVDGGAHQLVDTRATKKDQTLFDVPKPVGGSYAGRCYAVTAYAGNVESEASPPFCARGTSAAKTVRLAATHTRTSMAYPGGARGTTGFEAGYWLHVNEPYNKPSQQTYSLERAAVAFDVTPYLGRRLVSAKLELEILDSTGMGNNHSCANSVGAGNEFWWRDQDPLDGSFGYNIVPTEEGPTISADVTPIVAHWLATSTNPNYGFVLKGDETLPSGLTERRCITKYTRPALVLTYY